MNVVRYTYHFVQSSFCMCVIAYKRWIVASNHFFFVSSLLFTPRFSLLLFFYYSFFSSFSVDESLSPCRGFYVLIFTLSNSCVLLFTTFKRCVFLYYAYIRHLFECIYVFIYILFCIFHFFLCSIIFLVVLMCAVFYSSSLLWETLFSYFLVARAFSQHILMGKFTYLKTKCRILPKIHTKIEFFFPSKTNLKCLILNKCKYILFILFRKIDFFLMYPIQILLTSQIVDFR